MPKNSISKTPFLCFVTQIFFFAEKKTLIWYIMSCISLSSMFLCTVTSFRSDLFCVTPKKVPFLSTLLKVKVPSTKSSNFVSYILLTWLHIKNIWSTIGAWGVPFDVHSIVHSSEPLLPFLWYKKRKIPSKKKDERIFQLIHLFGNRQQPIWLLIFTRSYASPSIISELPSHIYYRSPNGW